jgi:hypothetical protein
MTCTSYTERLLRSAGFCGRTWNVVSCGDRTISMLYVKVKVKLSRYWQVGDMGKRSYSSYSFLTLVLDGVEWSVSRPGRALPLGKDPRYPLYRSLGGPQRWSGHRPEEKSFCLCRESNSGHPVHVRHKTDSVLWCTVYERLQRTCVSH